MLTIPHLIFFFFLLGIFYSYWFIVFHTFFYRTSQLTFFAFNCEWFKSKHSNDLIWTYFSKLVIKKNCSWMHFLGASNFLQSFTAIINFGRARPFFKITMIVFDWKQIVISSKMTWGRVNRGLIKIFGWTIPLKSYIILLKIPDSLINSDVLYLLCVWLHV